MNFINIYYDIGKVSFSPKNDFFI